MQFQTFKNKQLYVSNFINIIRDKGGAECWVLNRKHFEVYHFKAEQITEFDVRIDLRNALTKELVISVNLVLHMKQSMLDLFEEVPGIIYVKKLDVFHDLYGVLSDKYNNVKTKKIKLELKERIEYIENEFPELII